MFYIKDSIHYTIHQIRQLHPQVSIPDGANLTDLGYYQIEPVTKPTAQPGERVTAGEPEEYESGKWREVWNVTAIPLSEVQAQRLNELAALRYQHETAGITLNGMAIDTSRESQAMINGAYAYCQLNPNTVIDWKSATGWIQLGSTEITVIAGAVAAHVQACFSNERWLSQMITQVYSVADVLALDLSVGWPE